ncbi:HEPN domain-containing protein [Thermoflexibacter ruber]|uniref:HEPN domain-containing protein n=1 Tax=Thermoflexibacter ruber TaxID=1003 RepID=UPI001C8747DE|nr:HEPN domain-containing protein [Thermoflexibacter ruber]
MVAILRNNGTMENQNYIFEIFCIDVNGQTEIKSETNLIQALCFTTKLWSSEVKDTSSNGRWTINDEKSKISVRIKSVDTTKVLTGYFEVAFNIKVESTDFEALESFRLKLLRHIKGKLSFSHIRVLSDDISTAIAQELYPQINKVESLLRRYLAKFFIQRVGLDWWETTAPKSMIDKVKIRKSDRKDEFSTLCETDVSLADFDDLGELIYKQSSGLNTPEKVTEKIAKISSLEELENFKTELKGNYTKYFKEFFRDKEFEQKWKELFKIRNKVAHHGVFYKNELDRGLELASSLSAIILDAENNIDEMTFSVEEKEAIRNATIEAIESVEVIQNQVEEDTENTNSVVGLKILGKIELPNSSSYKGYYKAITEEELLNELHLCEDARNYVGLKWFVTQYLAEKEFSIGLSYSLINILADKNKIELYDIQEGYVIKAIRLKK